MGIWGCHLIRVKIGQLWVAGHFLLTIRLGMRFSDLVTVVIKAIQEQQELIEAQNKKM